MTRSFAFLVNPHSGGGAAPEAVVPVARALRDAGAEVDVTYSPGPQAMAALVDDAVAAGHVVVSVGGDGMLASLAGLVSHADGLLGIVPAGRGNDFARMLGIPDDAAGQARVLLESAERRVDLLELDGHRVAGSVYAGVDARTAAKVNRMKRVPKKAQYPLAGVWALATYSPARFRVEVDGEVSHHGAALVAVANSAYYGKGMKIAPGAVVDDGLAEVVIVEAASRWGLMRAMPTLYDGSHVQRDEVTVLRGKRISLSADSPAPVEVGGDGEPLADLPTLAQEPRVIEVVPGALRVLA